MLRRLRKLPGFPIKTTDFLKEIAASAPDEVSLEQMSSSLSRVSLTDPSKFTTYTISSQYFVSKVANSAIYAARI